MHQTIKYHYGGRPHFFPVLNTISSIMRGFGWILIGVGVLIIPISFWFVNFSLGGYGHLITVVISILLIINGLFVVAAGEAIGVLFAIEENTRYAAGRVRSNA